MKKPKQTGMPIKVVSDIVLSDKLEVLTTNINFMAFRLMYSILPISVANELRHHRPVPASKHEKVTILFSGIVGFSEFCAQHSDAEGAIMIINLLNEVYVKFDDLLKTNTDVYKVSHHLRLTMAIFNIVKF